MTLDALVRQLREAMAQATPGPWEVLQEDGFTSVWNAEGDTYIANCTTDAADVDLPDAEYIALASPANMATLLDALGQPAEPQP